MSNYFVTSDEHYGHEKIIELANRPFTSVEEQTETLIERHNKTVPAGLGHTTIHVGDLFWHTLKIEEAITILSRLNGRHAFIFGNHDELIEANIRFMSNLFTFIVGENKASGSKIIRHNKHKLTLNHYAQRVWDGSHKGHWHCYGHSHGCLPGLGKSFDIGVDSHDFKPWALEEIEAKMNALPQHHTVDNTGREDTVNESISGSLSVFDKIIHVKDGVPTSYPGVVNG